MQSKETAADPTTDSLGHMHAYVTDKASQLASRAPHACTRA